jgi:hypothetical protein
VIPDYAEPLTGYRCWYAYPNGLLIGQACHEAWPLYQPFVARCAALTGNGWRAHLAEGAFVPPPVVGCDCGIHAFKAQPDAEMRLRAMTDSLSYEAGGDLMVQVWGRVALWGRVIEHEIGYRAACAYPAALWCEDPERATAVSALYGVPCEVQAIKPRHRTDDLGVVYWYRASPPMSAATPSPAPPLSSAILAVPPPTLYAPSASAVAMLGSSRYQQQEALRVAQQGYRAVDWGAMWKAGFKVPKVIGG